MSPADIRNKKRSDYDKVFAATLPGVSFCALIAWIADKDLETDNIDAVKAFTQAEIDRKLYCELPVGFTGPDEIRQTGSSSASWRSRA